MTNPAIIFDIDGTLANNSARQKILVENKNNWKSFFETMGDDAPNKSIVELFNVFKKTGKYKMLIVSARPDNYHKLTEQWLTWNYIEYDELFLRKEKDHRQDYSVKYDILQKIRKNYDVRFVIDDRSSVVKMWREQGLTCLQCYDHNF